MRVAKRIIGTLFVSVYVLGASVFAHAQTSTPPVLAANQRGAAEKEVEMKVRALKKELNAKIKALREEYAAKIRALRASVKNKSQPTITRPAKQEELKKKPDESKVSAQKITVEYKDNAFSQPNLKLGLGSTATFINKHTSGIRIASNPHPFHTSKPKFDSDTLGPGESWSFTFSEKGKVNYHNHFNSAAQGSILVE